MEKLFFMFLCFWGVCRMVFAFDPTRVGGYIGNVRREKDPYPEFSVQYNANNQHAVQYGNCTKHGKVRFSKVSMCGSDGKVIARTGCEQCLRLQHDENVRKLKEKAEKAKETEQRRTQIDEKRRQEEELEYERGLKRRREEELEYERGIVSSLTITNGETLFFNAAILDLLPFYSMEFEIFQFVKKEPDGRCLYLAYSRDSNDRRLYALSTARDDFADGDRTTAYGYSSKRIYEYTTTQGATKRVRVFMDNPLSIYLDKQGLMSGQIVEVFLKENYFSSKEVKVKLTNDETRGRKLMPKQEVLPLVREFKHLRKEDFVSKEVAGF